MLEHGGRLLQAAQRYGIPRERWVDLSTGINPVGWQGISAPLASWNRLPEEEDGLVEAAKDYYYGQSGPGVASKASSGVAGLLPACGSQAAIQALPRLRERRSRVGVPELGYNEHAHRWQQAGHEVVALPIRGFEAALEDLDVLVVSNPNNPTGDRFSPEQLLEWHARLSSRGGWLVVDEAFGDSAPESSIAGFTGREGLIVLRSLGKFFGLAGARVGFVLASERLLRDLSEWLGPWSVAGPARWIAKEALRDRAWQQSTRVRLRGDSHRLAALLASNGLQPTGGCDLFQWVKTDRALETQEALARQGILTRYFALVPSLRFGLPAVSEHWQRLEAAL